MKPNYAATTLGELVTDHPTFVPVFERYRLDYCCGGHKTLDEACKAKGAPLDQILADLEVAAQEPPVDTTDWTKASLASLADHIVETHHNFLRRELPKTQELADKVAAVHGASHPEMIEVRKIYTAMRRELETHMWKEESILFPFCKQLDSADTAPDFHCGSVMGPITVMKMEHESAGRALDTIREITGNYAVPADACFTYKYLFYSIQEIEKDLHVHIHKENNILFPRAAALEEAFAAKA